MWHGLASLDACRGWTGRGERRHGLPLLLIAVGADRATLREQLPRHRPPRATTATSAPRPAHCVFWLLTLELNPTWGNAAKFAGGDCAKLSRMCRVI